MIVQLTNAGAALLTAAGSPIERTSFELGSDYGYVPAGTDTNIHGTEVYSGAPSPYVVVNANVVKYSVYLDYPLGPFYFGELGLYVNGTLFALAVSSVLIQKLATTTTAESGNSIRLDVYLSMVGTNYSMWLDYASSSNEFQMAVLGSVDYLPQPQNAVPNAYVITGAGSGQAAFLAYTNQSGLWNFDAYAYANQATATITAFDTQSVTIALSQYVPGMTPAYLGEVIAEFSTGVLYGICRYVSTVVTSGGSVTLGFDNPLMQTPAIGDEFVVFGRQALSTTIPNLPIASPTVLGGVKVGTTLTIATDGTLNVAAGSYPVTSVNGLTGAVVLTASNITGLATVATTGEYSDLIGAPPAYTLPIASTTVLGGVKAPTADSNLTIASNGVIDLGFPPVKTVNAISPDGTGNVTIPPASVIGLVNPASIAASTDFNTLQTAGLFYGLDANASTFVNAPNTTVGGTLDVEPFTTTGTGGDVIQRYTQATGLFFRRYTASSNTWSSWLAVSTSNVIPAATTSVIGGVIVGTGLNITTPGVLSTQIQTVNGYNAQNIVLAASDVGAIPTTAYDAQGGVPQLNSATSPVPATDPYTFGRMRFWENTLGTWWNAGAWDAATNHVAQTGNNLTTFDTNTSLTANGTQTIDISYGGHGRAGIATGDYQSVSAEGMVYKVAVAGTTSLDGNAIWNVGDLVVAVNQSWYRIAGPGPNLLNQSSGYRTNADGTIEMWGTAGFVTGTNSINVTLPVAIPTAVLNWSVTDGGSENLSYAIEFVNSTTITVTVAAYYINTSGAITARSTASGSWRMLVH
jgi:hypothetical protein